MSGWNKTTNADDKAYKFETAGFKSNITLTDRGFEYMHPNGLSEVLVAIQGGLSKAQGGADAATAPTTVWTLPVDKTYLEGDKVRFVLTSTESLVVTGTPRVAITLNAPGSAVVYANYVPSASKKNRLVFQYTRGVEADNGQIASAVFQLNAGTIKEIDTAADVTPAAMPAVAGILMG